MVSLAMMKKKKLITILCLILTLTSCDDGRLYEKLVIVPEEGRVVKLTGRLTGIDEWTSEYSVVVAGFLEDNEYAVYTKTLSADAENEVEEVMKGIGEDVKSIELCVVNRLRKRIMTFHTADVNTSDTIRMDVGTMDVGMYASIQEQMFNTTCVGCHGASNFAGAGLYLTEGKSYDALVRQPSKLINDKLLVEPGNANESVLYQAITSDVSNTWKINHSNMVISTPTSNVLKAWINNLKE